MVYNNRDYPHPVMGVMNNVGGELDIHLNVKAGKDTIRLESIYHLDNDDLKSLIEEEKACYTVQVYCRSTMYRQVFKSNKSISEQIVIQAYKLRDQVELDFFICASEDLEKYCNSRAHKDYDNASFSIAKGDILAYGGHGLFYANKTPEELKAVSSFMQIDRYDVNNGPIQNFYDGDKIIIRLSKNDYEKYIEVAGNQYSEQLLHSAVVLPALMDAINKTNTSTEFEECSWFQILKKLIEEQSKGNDNPLFAGQKILDNPLNRTFKTIDNLLYQED